jgi:hypothetical protein
MESRAIKMPAHLWEFLGALGEELGYHDSRGDHSRLVREMVSAAATRWLESPYIARSSKNFVLITRDGHLFYRQIQVLKLNKARNKLPFLLDFFASRRSEAAPSKPRWLLNHFAVWEGGDASSTEAEPLAAGVDRYRTDAKLADLEVGQGRERILTREIVSALEDYVQWKGSEREDDRVDFPVDIPMLNLEILVVVDLDLYRKTAEAEHEKRQVPNLKLEFRNRELARFEGETIGQDEFNRLGPPLRGKVLATGGGPAIPKVARSRRAASDPKIESLQSCRDLKARVEHFAQAHVSDGPVVPAKDRKPLLEALAVPESFLYYKMRWPSPYIGVEVGIQWEKPEKPE